MRISIEGKVIHGKKRGRILGYPTINLKIKEHLVAQGVYRGLVQIGDRQYKAAIFKGAEHNMIEAYILGFSGDLYGQAVKIIVEEKIREVKQFKRLEDLKAQIAQDIRNLFL
jgi:riboflavin kinase/FMN adenylyltransferase